MCGCRGNANKPAVKTVVPNQKSKSIIKTVLSKKVVNAPAPGIKTTASGMTKQQRDEERKKRIQMILKRKSQL